MHEDWQQLPVYNSCHIRHLGIKLTRMHYTGSTDEGWKRGFDALGWNSAAALFFTVIGPTVQQVFIDITDYPTRIWRREDISSNDFTIPFFPEPEVKEEVRRGAVPRFVTGLVDNVRRRGKRFTDPSS